MRPHVFDGTINAVHKQLGGNNLANDDALQLSASTPYSKSSCTAAVKVDLKDMAYDAASASGASEVGCHFSEQSGLL
jgi:hypothetical protein